MNVFLSHIKEKSNSEINKKEVFKQAWVIYRNTNYNFQESLKAAWLEAKFGIMKISFWTDADAEDIAYTIHSCCKNGIVNVDLLRNWDKNQRRHPLDWVSYHLRRYGFEISQTKQGSYDYVEYNDLPVINV